MRFFEDVLERLSAGDIPNKFTLKMGELIRNAREDAGLSQRELAELIYRRQAALSNMENGKMEPNASTIVYLAFNLKKPISYFFPKPYKPDSCLDDLSELDKEILFYVKSLDRDDELRILAQLKGLFHLDTKQE